MQRLNVYSVAVFLALLTPAALSAQVKLAEVPGQPGSFDLSTSLAFRSTGDTGFVSNPGSGLVQKFRVSTGEILGELQLPPGVGPLALSFDERFLVVAGVATQRIYIIDPRTMNLRHEGEYANSGFTGRSNVVINERGDRIFIADPSRDGVAVFDMADAKFDRLIRVGINPNIMNLLPDRRRVAVLCSGRKQGDEESLHIIDTERMAVIDVRVLTDPSTAAPFNTEPFNNASSNITGDVVYLSSFNDDRIGVYDLQSRFLSSRPSHGRGPAKIVSSPNGRFLAIVNATSNDVALLSLPEATLVKVISLPEFELSPETVPAFSPDSRVLFVPSPTTNEVVAFDVEVASVALQRRILTGRGPERLLGDAEGVVITSLDLGGNVLSLIALHPRAFNIPHLTQTATDYSGMAVANFGQNAASVALLARGNGGAPLSGTSNPRLMTIPAGQQVSLVTAQIFGLDTLATLDGYIEAYTLEPDVTMLYMSGAIRQTRLDGFIADAMSSKLLGFTGITQGVSKFGSTTSTEIILVNTGQTAASLTLQMYAPNPERPAALIAFQNRQLPPQNRVRIAVSDLVPPAVIPLQKAYLTVDSTVPVKGMLVVRIGDSETLIPATERGLPDTSFSATQFATGGAGVLDTPIDSYLSMSNSSQEAITVTAQVRDGAGNPIPADSQPFVRTLVPQETVFGGASEIFGFPDPLSDPAFFQGTLDVSVDKKGLIASLMFGDARNGKYLTAESLHPRTGRKFALVHFAEGVFGEPPRGMFTGLAMFNGNIGTATVLVEAFAPDGTPLGLANVNLPGNSHLSRTVGQMLPALRQQNGGTLIITSDLPIQLFEVFGSSGSEFLVAVEPVILQP